jgi:hypothetical protein
MAGPVKAYSLAVATGASTIGGSRARLRSLGIYATDASTFTVTNGNGGATVLTGAFPLATMKYIFLMTAFLSKAVYMSLRLPELVA